MRETTWMETIKELRKQIAVDLESLPLWGKLLEWKPYGIPHSDPSMVSPFMRETTWMET